MALKALMFLTNSISTKFSVFFPSLVHIRDSFMYCFPLNTMLFAIVAQIAFKDVIFLRREKVSCSFEYHP